MIEEIKNIAENNFNEIVKIRRYLHQNPRIIISKNLIPLNIFNHYFQNIIFHLQMDMLQLELLQL